MRQFLLALVLITGSQFSLAKDLQIFFIHGLNDTKETFCNMPNLIEQHFNMQGHRVKTTLLEYSTFDDENSTSDFVLEIKKQIKAHYEKNNLPADAPYSFVVHSQGGIVALKYLYRELKPCYHDDPEKDARYKGDKNRCDVPYNFQDLVSMGSPFWGSQGASTSHNKTIDWALRKFSGKYKQLADLRIGSVSLGNSRREMLSRVDRKTGEWKHPIPGNHQIKIHNLAGEIFAYLDRGFNGIDRFSENTIGKSLKDGMFGDLVQESDVIVSPASARIDFNYLIERAPGEKALEGSTQLGHSYGVIPDSHMQLDGPLAPGFAFKNKNQNKFNALVGMQCNPNEELQKKLPKKHLATRFALNVFGNYFEDRRDARVLTPYYPNPDGLNNYFVDIQLHIPSTIVRKPRAQRKNIKITQSEPGKISHEILETGSLVRGFSFNDDGGTGANKKYLSFFHDGRFNQYHSENCCDWTSLGDEPMPSTRLTYDVEIPGFELKSFEIPVEISKTTFVRVFLKPYHPLPPKKQVARYIRKNTENMQVGEYVVAMDLANYSFNRPTAIVVSPSNTSDEDGLRIIELDEQDSQVLNKDLVASANKCFVGLTAASPIHTGIKIEPGTRTNTYLGAYTDQVYHPLKPGAKVKVLGRLSRPPKSGERQGKDRYLVAAPPRNPRFNLDKIKYGEPMADVPRIFKGMTFDNSKDRLFWVDVSDVDVVKGESCADNFLPVY